MIDVLFQVVTLDFRVTTLMTTFWLGVGFTGEKPSDTGVNNNNLDEFYPEDVHFKMTSFFCANLTMSQNRFFQKKLHFENEAERPPGKTLWQKLEVLNMIINGVRGPPGSKENR